MLYICSAQHHHENSFKEFPKADVIARVNAGVEPSVEGDTLNIMDYSKNTALENFPNEEWRVIETYPDYMVSNYGRIKSFKGECPTVLICANMRGYRSIQLFVKGTGKTELVHRLVAKAFIPNPEKKLTVNHKNGVKNDNRVENLEWCTEQENAFHAYINGLYDSKISPSISKLGVENYHGKVSEEEVIKMKLLYNEGTRFSDICKMYPQLGKASVSDIVRNRRWKYLNIPCTREDKGTRKPQPVCQISLDGFLLGVYDSQAEAIRVTGITGISGAVKGIKQKTAGGYYWK